MDDFQRKPFPCIFLFHRGGGCLFFLVFSSSISYFTAASFNYEGLRRGKIEGFVREKQKQRREPKESSTIDAV